MARNKASTRIIYVLVKVPGVSNDECSCYSVKLILKQGLLLNTSQVNTDIQINEGFALF